MVSLIALPGVSGRVVSSRTILPRAVTSTRLAPGLPVNALSNARSSPSLPTLKPGVINSGFLRSSYSLADAAPT